MTGLPSSSQREIDLIQSTFLGTPQENIKSFEHVRSRWRMQQSLDDGIPVIIFDKGDVIVIKGDKDKREKQRSRSESKPNESTFYSELSQPVQVDPELELEENANRDDWGKPEQRGQSVAESEKGMHLKDEEQSQLGTESAPGEDDQYGWDPQEQPDSP